MVDEAGSPPIYNEYLTVVASGAGANEINVGDAESGDYITLPNSGTYEGEELWVFLNGNHLAYPFDYNYVGSGTMTQVSMTFDLVVGDVILFIKHRGL